MIPDKPDFVPDVDRIAAACTANTRAVILNAPNNPTGWIYPERIYQELGRALAARSAANSRPIYLIFDDPYRHVYYTAEPPPEPAIPAEPPAPGSASPDERSNRSPRAPRRDGFRQTRSRRSTARSPERTR